MVICLKVFIARNSILPIFNIKLEKKNYGKQKERNAAVGVNTFFPTPTPLARNSSRLHSPGVHPA